MRAARFILLVLLAIYAGFATAQPEREAKSLRVLLDNDFLNFRAVGTIAIITIATGKDIFLQKNKKQNFRPQS